MPIYRAIGDSTKLLMTSPDTITPPVTPTRDSIVYGASDQPLPVNGVNCGLLDESLLTDFNPSTTQTVTLIDGGYYENLRIHGDVRLPTNHTRDIIAKNVLWRGGPHIPTSNDAVLKFDNTRTGAGRFKGYDCEIRPQTPALNRDGVRGNRIEIHRFYIHDVIDGVFLYATAAQNSGQSYAYLYGSLIENLRYGIPDYDNGVSGTPEHTSPPPFGDGTHNDCLVIGGKSAVAIGNYLRGTATDLPYVGSTKNPYHSGLQAAGYSNGQCVLITYTGTYPDMTSKLTDNWITGGLAHISVLPGITMDVARNKHYREIYAAASNNLGRWIRHTQRAGDGTPTLTDRWIDGPYAGNLLTEPRDLGIIYEA